MKTPVLLSWMPGLLLATAWLPVGLAQNTNTPTTTAPATAVNPANTATVVSRDVVSLTGGTATASAVVGNQPASSEMRLSPWTKEIVKLAQSGIDEEVMLSFIDNSGLFNLGADQIVFLSDLGVSDQIVSEMLKHDREMMSGIKPVTIVSELASEIQFPPSWKTGAGVSRKTTAQPVPAPAPGAVSLPAEHRSDNAAQPAVVQCAMVSGNESDEWFVSRQTSQPSGKGSIYRVREPNPVELLPPIVFMNEAQPPANTIIIHGFPRDTPTP